MPLAQWRGARGQLRPLMRRDDRRIDWAVDSTATVLPEAACRRQLSRAWPDTLFGATLPPVRRVREALGGQYRRPRQLCWRGAPNRCCGAPWTARCGSAMSSAPAASNCPPRWPSRPPPGPRPAEGWWRATTPPGRAIAYEEDGVGARCTLRSTTAPCPRASASACRRLWPGPSSAQRAGAGRGPDFWSNGIHLNMIEAASLGEGRPRMHRGTTSTP